MYENCVTAWRLREALNGLNHASKQLPKNIFLRDMGFKRFAEVHIVLGDPTLMT